MVPLETLQEYITTAPELHDFPAALLGPNQKDMKSHAQPGSYYRLE